MKLIGEFCMFSAKSFITLLILPFLISRVSFLDISMMVDAVLDALADDRNFLRILVTTMHFTDFN